MRSTLALGAAFVLAGCNPNPGEDAAERPKAQEGESSSTAPAKSAEAAAPRGAAIGTRSTLSAQTSGLTGAVTDFRVTVTDMGTTVALATDTLFEFDQAELAPNALPNLRRVADMIREGGAGTVTITGHTDSKGDDAYNQTLSQRRAQAVATWLRQQTGLGRRPFFVVGKGEAAPVTPNAQPDGSDNPEGRARNRRVEVDIPRA